ncbi:MAG: gamma-glutamylcyclotransferase family protein [Thermoanaerobaculia bacterium]|nr:gamma-glutamylcyclotransferase family protein [Thermoanaerobaculia bacterium]
MASSYFAYGINMDRDHFKKLCPDAVSIAPAVLEDHRFFVNRAGWATVVPAGGKLVHGVLWRVDSSCLEKIDRFEGVDEDLYRRTRMTVSCLAGEMPAEVYVATDPRPGRPRSAYIDSIVRAATLEGFPRDYLQGLDRWAKETGES